MIKNFKRIISLFMAFVLTIGAIVIVSAAGGNEGGDAVPNDPNHTHTYREIIVDPTCTKQGFTYFNCACGATYKGNYTNALGHNHQKVATNAATCIDAGEVLYSCSRCNDSYVTAIGATGHRVFSGFPAKNKEKNNEHINMEQHHHRPSRCRL